MFFQYKIRYLVVNIKKILYLCEEGIGKSDPHNDRLSSLSNLTLMMDSYSLA